MHTSEMKSAREIGKTTKTTKTIQEYSILIPTPPRKLARVNSTDNLSVRVFHSWHTEQMICSLPPVSFAPAGPLAVELADQMAPPLHRSTFGPVSFVLIAAWAVCVKAKVPVTTGPRSVLPAARQPA